MGMPFCTVCWEGSHLFLLDKDMKGMRGAMKCARCKATFDMLPSFGEAGEGAPSALSHLRLTGLDDVFLALSTGGNMRAYVPSAIVLALFANTADAETWQAQPVRIDAKSVSSRCGFIGPLYTFELIDSQFTASTNLGKSFTITIPADGKIAQKYGGWYEMVGNVRTKQLEIIGGLDCKWTLRNCEPPYAARQYC